MSRLGVALCTGLLVGIAGPARANTEAHAFTSVVRAHLHPVPLWPVFVPDRIGNGNWTVSNLRGVQPYPAYPDYTASGPSAFAVFYSYRAHIKGACAGCNFGGGGFSRTSRRGLDTELAFERRTGHTERHIRLGGRNVIAFSSDTRSMWAFASPGGYYVFQSNDFGGPSARTVGRMIASMRPISHLSPP